MAKAYKGVLVGKGCSLDQALEKGDAVEAKKVFDATTERFKSLYAANDDWKWFMEKSK